MERKIIRSDFDDMMKMLQEPGHEKDEVLGVYDHWANNYEQDNSLIGYRGPQLTANMVSKLVENKDDRILDVGAGTGLVGKELHKLGYTNLDALEPSRELLHIAKNKGIYKKLFCEGIGTTKLDIDKGYYSAVTASGCFAPGHMPPEALRECVRIVKQDGYIIFLMREVHWNSLCDKLQEVIQDLKARKMVSDIHVEPVPEYHIATEYNPSAIPGIKIVITVSKHD
ncbi:methyltransferase-like protein 27 [Saccoglossus kowalevskii]